MSEKNMSVLDAFLALEDLEDEEVKAPLKEGKGFNVRDDVEMDKAKNFIEHQEKKEPELEVIDVDADSIEHLKNNEEYVGQIVLQCNSCKANRFIKAEDLVPSEGDENVYNIEDECPHCHGTGNGYTLKGQVGKYETEEPKIENDSLTDEPKFDNNVEDEQPAEEEPQEQEPEEEEPSEQMSFEEPNNDAMETTAEDDTVDMKSTLGDEFDSNDVEYDDTEERPEEPTEEDSLTDNNEDEYEEPLSPVEEPKEDEDKKKEEDLEEDVQQDDQIVSDFTETIIEPENIENVLVFDLDGDEEEQIFEGKFEDLPQDIFNAEFIGFDVGQGNLIINIDSDSTIDELTPTVRLMLNKFLDDFNESISVWDQASGDEVFSGTKQSVLEEYGNEAFLSFEAPERLELKVRSLSLTDSLKTPYQEDLDFANPEEKLISNILKENNLREYRVNKFGSEEYWIAESIKEREDLKHIFENYIKPKSSKLVLEFKNVTGFKDKFDLVAEEENECLTEDLEDDAREEAKKHFEDAEVESVIYGYESRGKFHRLQGDLLEIRNDRELRMATELVKAKYHPTGSVKVLYRDSVSESVDCRNRKELTEAILDCESKGIAYTIKRAVKEGYRYTLIKEEAERGFFTDEEGELESSDTDSRDIDLADTILRITDDIADTFNAKGATTDKRLIAADILNDLEIITAEQSDKVKSVDPAENLRNVVIEVLTGLNNKVDRYAESEDEDNVLWAEERKEDFETLNGDTFTKDAIEARFQDIDASSAHDIPGVVFPEAETECLREGLIYISADTNNLTDDQINKGLDLVDAGELKERIPVALEGEEDLFLVANKGKNYLGHRKDIDNYLNLFRNEPANEAISRDEFLKNHPQAAASDKVEDHLEDCLKEAEKSIDTDFYPEGDEFSIDTTDIFTKVLKGKVKFNFDVLKAIAQYLMEKLPGMYDYLNFEVEALPRTFIVKYKLKPTNESLNESEEDEYQKILEKGINKIDRFDCWKDDEWYCNRGLPRWKRFKDKIEKDTTTSPKEKIRQIIKFLKTIDLLVENSYEATAEDIFGLDMDAAEELFYESLNEDKKDKCKKTFRILTDDGMVFEIDACSEEEARKEFEEVGYDENTGWPNQRVKQHIKDIKLKEYLNESEEDIYKKPPFYICYSNNKYVDQPEQFFNKEGVLGNYNRKWHFVDFGSATPYNTREEAEKDTQLVKEALINDSKFLGEDEPVFADEKDEVGFDDDVIVIFVGNKFELSEVAPDLFLDTKDEEVKNWIGESLNESKEDKKYHFDTSDNNEEPEDLSLEEIKKIIDFNLEGEPTRKKVDNFLKGCGLKDDATRKEVLTKLNLEEDLSEAKKDDELPADPEVVKTNVHATLNNLVTDEIEAINGYEEAKAEIADTHIEHKDDIIDTIDHIEDEEQEHIDELIDAASEIPFEKEGHEEIEEPIEEPEIEEEPDFINEPEEEVAFENNEVEEALNEDIEPTEFNLNKFKDQVKELLENEDNKFGTLNDLAWSALDEMSYRGQIKFDRAWFEQRYPDDDEKDITYMVDNVSDADAGAYFNHLIEKYNLIDFLKQQNVSVEETLDFDETKFESFINEWFNQNVEDTQVFEAVKGNFTDDGTIILEGKLISEDKEQGVKFTLTPNREMNEDLMDSKKVTTYTITSTCLPEGLVLKESYLWFHGNIRFKTKEEAQNFVDEFMKPQEECIEPSREIRHIEQIIPNKENQSDFDKEYPYIVSYFTGDIRDDKSEEATKLVRHFWSEFDKRESK